MSANKPNFVAAVYDRRFRVIPAATPFGPPEARPPAQAVSMRLRGARTGKRSVVCESLELTGLMRPFDLEVWYGERVAVLGSTGSIGTTALRVLDRQRQRFRVTALTANSNSALLREQARLFSPTFVGMVESGGDADEAWQSGTEALIAAATREDVDIVLNAIVGAAGLDATLARLGEVAVRGGPTSPDGMGGNQKAQRLVAASFSRVRIRLPSVVVTSISSTLPTACRSSTTKRYAGPISVP